MSRPGAMFLGDAVVLSPETARMVLGLARRSTRDFVTHEESSAVLALSRAVRALGPRENGLNCSDGVIGVSTTEAARRLGTTTGAIRKRIDRGQLEAYREGSRWRVVLD